MKDKIINSGFSYFWSSEGKEAISNVKLKYYENFCSNEQKVIAKAFIKSENVLLHKLMSAIRLENNIDSNISPIKLDTIENVMIKPVSDICNLACTYCYEGDGDNRYKYSTMPLSTLELIIEQSFQNVKDQITFLWHGGEPTLAGISFFEKAVNLQQKYNTKCVNVNNIIQTNGITIDDRWLSFFLKNRFYIGLSLDGNKEINDGMRVDHKGSGTFDKVMSAIKGIKSYGMEFGIIMVVNEAHKGRAGTVFNFLLENDIYNFDIHPGYGQKFKLHPKDYSEFVIEIFDLWLKSGNEKIRISMFDDLFQFLIGEMPSTCYFAGTCTKIFAIESDGNIVPCTRPFDRSKYTFGNIKTTALVDILKSDSHEEFKKKDLISQSNSKSCPWYSICHNGCPQHRSNDGLQDILGTNLYCKCQSGEDGGNFEIWSHVNKAIRHYL